MTNVGDLAHYAGFRYGDNRTLGIETASSRRFAKTRIPANSTINQRGIARFQKRVDTVIQKDAEKDVNRKYTYVELADSDAQGGVRMTVNLRRGDDTRDRFIGMGIRPLYFKLQYILKVDWTEANPLKIQRLIVVQWLNATNDTLVGDVLLDNTGTDPTIEKWVLAYKNPGNMDNFVVLADHVKVAKPMRGNGNGAANPVTSVWAVGEIYVAGKQMVNILLSKDINAGTLDFVPIKGMIGTYMVKENPQTEPAAVISYIAELCYTDKM